MQKLFTVAAIIFLLAHAPLRARNRDKDYPAALNVGTAVGALGSLVGTVVGAVIFCIGTVAIVTELNFFPIE